MRAKKRVLGGVLMLESQDTYKMLDSLERRLIGTMSLTPGIIQDDYTSILANCMVVQKDEIFAVSCRL